MLGWSSSGESIPKGEGGDGKRIHGSLHVLRYLCQLCSERQISMGFCTSCGCTIPRGTLKMEPLKSCFFDGFRYLCLVCSERQISIGFWTLS